MKQLAPATLKTLRRIGITVVGVASVAGVLIGGWGLWQWQRDSRANVELKEEIIKTATDDSKPEGVRIDFEKLRAENSDTVAYIKLGSLNIDYPVVKTSDNSYYLDHNFHRDYNIAGWIFADYRNNFDGEDKNTIIYGHNSYDENMFSLLYRALERDWQSRPENLHIGLYLPENPEEAVDYQIFSTYTYEPEDYYLTTDFAGEADFKYFIDTIRGRSNYDYGVEVGAGDKILTLSSCTPDAKARIVIHAKKS